MEKSVNKETIILNYSPANLAYLGDAVVELFVRTYLLGNGDITVAHLNENSREYVTASKQSQAVEKLLPLLDEKEMGVYRRGRNMKVSHSPKNSSVLDYRRATGLECVFGYLFLSGEKKRAEELFYECFSLA